MKAVIITTDGEKSVVEFTNETSYATLKGAVDGYIEVVHLPNIKADMWVNEEGKLLALPQNPTGTALWVDNYGPSDYTAGNIIITGLVDNEGETLGLSDEQVEYFLNYTKQVVVPEEDRSIYEGWTVSFLP